MRQGGRAGFGSLRDFPQLARGGLKGGFLDPGLIPKPFTALELFLQEGKSSCNSSGSLCKHQP